MARCCGLLIRLVTCVARKEPKEYPTWGAREAKLHLVPYIQDARIHIPYTLSYDMLLMHHIPYLGANWSSCDGSDTEEEAEGGANTNALVRRESPRKGGKGRATE